MLELKTLFYRKLEEYKAGKLILSPEDKESYQKLTGLEIYRTLVKKAVMTIPYNASSASIIEYIKNNFDKQRASGLWPLASGEKS